ncbi:unnamed protein product [Lepidochelys kempii]
MAAPPGGYFRCASRFWIGVIAVSIGYFAWAVFLPSTIPYENLGQLGHFTKYLVDNHPKLLYNGFWLAWGIHIAEALYSIKLCKRPKASLTALFNVDGSSKPSSSV